MSAPPLRGIHHLKLPVTDLEVSLAWYRRVFAAHHLDAFDHFDRHGVRYAVILVLPGVDVPVELRWAPHAARAMRGYDPVSFVAGTTAELEAWIAHLDAVGVDHSPVVSGLAGQLVVFRDPDGTYLRVLTLPEGGFGAIRVSGDADEPTGPWLMPHLMRRP